MVLIISNTQDPTADVVVRELRHRDAQFVRLNTDEFPRWIRGSFSINGSKIKKLLIWDNRDQEVDLTKITSVWYRRPIRPQAPVSLSEVNKKFVEDECYDFLRGLWYSLNCFWVSRPDSIRQAEHKIFQLNVAARLGLPIPQTLISNDPDRIRKFVQSCKNTVVAKSLYMGFIDCPPRMIFTNVVSPEHLADTESLKVSPVIFQERVVKVCDIRVTVIGSKVFACEIWADLPETIPDWRASPIDKLKYKSHQLPHKLEQLCIALLSELGLEFGAIDLAIDRNGSYSFFEVNPNGQWAWLEPEVGHPLTKTLVNLLTAPHESQRQDSLA